MLRSMGGERAAPTSPPPVTSQHPPQNTPTHPTYHTNRNEMGFSIFLGADGLYLTLLHLSAFTTTNNYSEIIHMSYNLNFVSCGSGCCEQAGDITFSGRTS